VSIERLHTKAFLKKDSVIIDVRSPGEFNHAHIPSAINMPLFNDEERKLVGTAYKQQSREQAIKIGLEFFGPKMRRMVEETEDIIRNKHVDGNPADKTVLVHCWRGGMRSGAVAWLLDLYGFKVYTLGGGYKAFRNQVLNTFEQEFSFKILGGYTGSGKTEVLKELENKGEAIINLEEIASHKGSAFGNINMPPQPSQEMFENILATRLWKIAGEDETSIQSNTAAPRSEEKCIWLEDESQRIGKINIPGSIWNRMRSSTIFFLEIPFAERLEHITEEYSTCDPVRLKDAIERITKKLGGLQARNAIDHLEKGAYKDCFDILLKYYDKLYLKALHNRENLSALLNTVNCNSVSMDNAKKLLAKHQPV
jgi:tRNA 2-selenouridine synthase